MIEDARLNDVTSASDGAREGGAEQPNTTLPIPTLTTLDQATRREPVNAERARAARSQRAPAARTIDTYFANNSGQRATMREDTENYITSNPISTVNTVPTDSPTRLAVVESSDVDVEAQPVQNSKPPYWANDARDETIQTEQSGGGIEEQHHTYDLFRDGDGDEDMRRSPDESAEPGHDTHPMGAHVPTTDGAAAAVDAPNSLGKLVFYPKLMEGDFTPKITAAGLLAAIEMAVAGEH